MVVQGKNAGNPDGLPSILTWQKQKLTFENRGSDNYCHANIKFERICFYERIYGAGFFAQHKNCS